MSEEDFNKIIKNIKFKGSWRSYQQRVLDELDLHLNDKKLNVVAAPGAGKTILGLEVFKRLEHPALILAPTITIKNQWKQRLIDWFLPENSDYSFISTDIYDVMPVTISTYQALHTIYKNTEERNKFIESLKKNNVQTVILDEAHHLRTEWYQTLAELCNDINSKTFTTVSLTGTPPYDVSPEEWAHYHSLCGAVDAEISIPELVKNKDLCPHQDLIYFSSLTEEEKNIIYDFEANRDEFMKFLNKDSDLTYAVASSVFVNDLEKNVDIIYKNTSFTLSVISYLLSIDSMDMNSRILAEFLGLSMEQIPTFDYQTAEILINGILGQFSEYFPNITTIKTKLKELKLLKGKKVDFSGETDFKNLFARSNNKLDAIADITRFEYNVQKDKLREVILLDYIGKGDTIGLNIFSVFDKLYPQNIKLGILTGTLIVIPFEAKNALYDILNRKNIASDKILTSNFNDDYLRVETYGNIDVVSVITELFEQGKINVLIGTAALLGEGWDSPCCNTLVIASVVGSFMLSNQMRGRALRTDKNNKKKTSNIWHLVSLCGDIEQSSDFQTIIKRFNTFEGISYNDNKIQNGVQRLDLDIDDIEKQNCDIVNAKMFEKAKMRSYLQKKWQQVFESSNITEEKMTSQVYEIVETHSNVGNELTYNGFFANVVNDLYKRHKVKLSEKEQVKIAKSILHTLCDMGNIKTPCDKITVKTIKDKDGKFNITLSDCLSNERNIFVKSFNEVFVFDDSTRYMLKIIDKEKEKYLPVPDIIGQKQENVKKFVKYLKGVKEKTKIKISNIKSDADSNIKKSINGHIIGGVLILLILGYVSFITSNIVFFITALIMLLAVVGGWLMYDDLSFKDIAKKYMAFFIIIFIMTLNIQFLVGIFMSWLDDPGMIITYIILLWTAIWLSCKLINAIFSAIESLLVIWYKTVGGIVSLFVKIVEKILGVKDSFYSMLQPNQKIDIIFTKSAKNQHEVLKAKYNIYLSADVKRSRVWI